MLVGCGTPAPAPETCDVSWEGSVAPVLTTWCTPCHASTVPEADRRGAPLGLDFDSWEEASRYADRIAAAAGPDTARMPPGGGLTEEQRAQLVRWADCGAPGEPAPVDPCAERIVHTGDGNPCEAGANTIAGDQGVDRDPGAGLDCLCEIDGDLVVTGDTRTLSLPRLVRVGGAVRADAPGLVTLALPALATAGSVQLTGLPLTELAIDALGSVSGAMVVTGGSLPPTFGPPRLRSVGTDLVFREVGGVVTFDLPRLEEVGGDLGFDRLPALEAVVNTSDLLTVGGSLRLVGNPQLAAAEDFSYLATVGGDVEIGGGGQLARIEAFWNLERIGGDLILRDEPLVATVDAFPEVLTVAGTVELSRLGIVTVRGFDAMDRIGGVRIVDNPSLRAWTGGDVSEVQGDVTLTGNPDLNELALVDGATRIDGTLLLADLGSLVDTRQLDGLARIGGSFLVARSPRLVEVGWPSLHGVGGSLALEANPALSGLQAFRGLDDVFGDLVIRDNPALPAAAVAELLERITVGGTTTVEGNGP